MPPIVFHRFRNTLLVGLHNLLRNFKLYLPFAILYFSDVAGSFTLGMSVIALRTFAIAMLEIPTGILSDRIGRKPTLVLGSLSSTAGIAAYAFAQDWGMPLLFAGSLLVALAESLYSGNNTALVYDTLKDNQQHQRFHHYLGQLESLAQFGMAVAALAGTILLVWLPLGSLLYISVVPASITVLLAFLVTEPQTHKRVSSPHTCHLTQTAFKKLSTNPKLMLLMTAQSISHGFTEASWQFRAAFIKTVWPVWAIGILNVIDHTCAVVGHWFGGSLLDRFRHRTIMIGYETINGLAQGLAAMMQNLLSPVFLLIPGFFWGAFDIAQEDALQREYSDSERATMASIVSFTENIVYVLTALLIGGIADYAGPAAALLAAAALQSISVVFYTKAFK